MSDYQPISCAAHDQFEIAIMRGQPLQARWRDGSGELHDERIEPLDLQVRDGTEWLQARAAHDEIIEIRLDWFDSLEPRS